MTDLRARPAATLSRVGGRLCIDFVNTVGARDGSSFVEERLHDLPDLLAWGLGAGVLDDRSARRIDAAFASDRQRAACFRRALDFREALFRVLQASLNGTHPPAASLRVVNREIVAARSSQLLESGRGTFAWRTPRADDTPEVLFRAVALSAAEFLTSDDVERLGVCRSDGCGWMFVDASKNRSRHWCDMRECGNQAKVRRFRARQR